MNNVWPVGGAALPDFKSFSLCMLLTSAIKAFGWLSQF